MTPTPREHAQAALFAAIARTTNGVVEKAPSLSALTVSLERLARAYRYVDGTTAESLDEGPPRS